MTASETDERERPSSLLITVEPDEETAAERERELVRKLERGERIPRVISFETPSQLRRLFTGRNEELIREVKREPPAHIQDLAERVGRTRFEVAGDLDVLAEYGIVRYRDDEESEMPYVPYDEVRIEYDLLRSI
ncbi:HVO_A0114 family putative DNA-binding protein [Halegenticoccus soli]|uniref:HVO_A0114 family putative DNA-binding protein n=1 Tax=Halegenticoccus soli TaxID=1985678 RepID=UPI000C6DE3B6|nr:transcriptional regulator [Halegenticoccus soli]